MTRPLRRRLTAGATASLLALALVPVLGGALGTAADAAARPMTADPPANPSAAGVAERSAQRRPASRSVLKRRPLWGAGHAAPGLAPPLSTPALSARALSARAMSAARAKQVARRMLPSRGRARQFRCLDPLWTRESNWNVHAGRPSRSYGIPQANPGHKMRSAGPAWRHDARTQIRWGLRYIRGRYGSPCGAWRFWQRRHWY